MLREMILQPQLPHKTNMWVVNELGRKRKTIDIELQYMVDAFTNFGLLYHSNIGVEIVLC
jgi:hypothetical protein